MTVWTIILVALWTYPILGYFIIRLTKNHHGLRKNIFLATVTFSGIAVLGTLTNISTTLSIIDWLIVTIPFLTACVGLWWIQFQKNQLVKPLGVIAMILVFGLGYFSSTLGALGLGFVIAEYETDREQWFDNGIIYKEVNLGNVFADYRGKRIEINRTISWLPIIEWEVTSKEYFNLMIYGQSLDATYNQIDEEIYLGVDNQGGDSIYYWSDTIRLKN